MEQCRQRLLVAATAATEVTVAAGVGPFAVESPNTAVTWTGGSTETVTWNVNGAEVLAGAVRISLSTNGGLTFPITLAANTPNDGSEMSTYRWAQTSNFAASQGLLACVGRRTLPNSGLSRSIT